MTNKYLYITLLAILGFSTESNADDAQQNAVPRLVVSITIDQLRSDYLENFASLYTEGGLRRLLSEGRVFANASYTFSPVDRASAMAAIHTGTTPYYNGIVGERWLSRETLRSTGCIDDEKFPGMFTSETASPSSLSTSTLGDELKVATAGKALVYSIAPYREAAVLAAGHAADAALWIDDIFGDWCSSTYYLKTPPEWLKQYNERSPIGKKVAKTVWEPFKHKFTGDMGIVNFKQSALVNSEVTAMALECITSTGLGSDNVSDLLCITYNAGIYDHKRVTECQYEAQDTYVRLDRELATLIDSLDKLYGRGSVLYVITSTGYCKMEAIDYATYRIPTGTFYMGRTADLANMYLGAFWGPGKYVEAYFRNQLFLNQKLLDTKKISIGEASTRAQEVVTMMSGVRNVYTSLQLLTGQSSRAEKTRNAFNTQHSGDLIIEVAPGWQILNEDTGQSELSLASYTQFPIIIFGAGTKSERVQTPVTTDRIAPTIARSIRIRAPNACSAEPLF